MFFSVAAQTFRAADQWVTAFIGLSTYEHARVVSVCTEFFVLSCCGLCLLHRPSDTWGWATQCLGCRSTSSNHRAPPSIPGHSMWVLWWTEWQSTGFLGRTSIFACQYLFVRVLLSVLTVPVGQKGRRLGYRGAFDRKCFHGRGSGAGASLDLFLNWVNCYCTRSITLDVWFITLFTNGIKFWKELIEECLLYDVTHCMSDLCNDLLSWILSECPVYFT
jgi:hypothetical protein